MIDRDLLLQRERPHSFGDGWGQSASGLYVPAEEAVESPPLGVDLFAGAGGFSLGFHMAGFHVIGALEWDVDATLTYLTNLGSPDTELVFATGDDKDRWDAGIAKRRKSKTWHGSVERDTWGSGWMASARADRYAKGVSPSPWDQSDDEPEKWCLDPCEVLVFGDAKQVSGADFLTWLGRARDEIAAIFGGPPCQGFSRGGKRQVIDERNTLVFDFMRIVCEMRPQTFLMENVTGMLSMVTPEGLPVVDALARIAEDGGFGTYDAIKRALLNTGGVAAMAGKPKEVGKKKTSRKKPKPDGPEQGALAV